MSWFRNMKLAGRLGLSFGLIMVMLVGVAYAGLSAMKAMSEDLSKIVHDTNVRIELIEKMGAYIGEHAQSGRFLGGEGLRASKTRTRLVFREGRATVKHGPYAGVHELVAATMLLQVRSREEAIGWAERYGKILVDGELELGPVTEPWDLGSA